MKTHEAKARNRREAASKRITEDRHDDTVFIFICAAADQQKTLILLKSTDHLSSCPRIMTSPTVKKVSAFSISAFAHPKDINLLNISLRSPCPKDFSISASLYLTRENRKRAGTQLKATGLSRVQTKHANLNVSITRMTLGPSKIPPACSGPKEDLEDDDNEEDSRTFPDDTRAASSSSSYRETAHSTGYHRQQEIPVLTKEMEYEESTSITTTNTREVRKYTTCDIINITEIIF